MKRAALEVRRGSERGYFDHGWLKTYHTFSFADYQDPAWMEFGPLRVINDDRVAAGEGFGKHGHRDMEILTYILAGRAAAPRLDGQRLDHPRRRRAAHERRHRRDPQRVQSVRGTEVHLLQIWITPAGLRDCRRVTSRSTSAPPTSAAACGSLPRATGMTARSACARRCAYSPDSFDGAESAGYQLAGGRRAWLQMARGELSVGDTRLEAGDGARTAGPAQLALHDGADAEVLLFDLP